VRDALGGKLQGSRKRLGLGATALCALACAVPAGASAATLSVPGDHPTVQAAVDAADPGDRIEVRARRKAYRESVEVGTPNIAIVGVRGRPVLDPAAEGSSPDIIDVTANGVAVRNLLLRSEGAYDCSADRCAVRNVVFRGRIDSNCIDLNGDRAIIAGSKFEACGNHAIDVDGAASSIVDNVIHHIDSDCIDLNGADHVVRRNNLSFCEDGNAVSIINGDGAIVARNVARQTDNQLVDVSGEDITVVGNRVARTDSECILVSGDGAVVEGNTGADCDGGVLIFGDGARVTENEISHVGGNECIDVQGNSAQVRENTLNACWKGITVRGRNMSITRNRVTNITVDDGIGAQCFDGVDDDNPEDDVDDPAACNNALVARNTVLETGDDDEGISFFVEEGDGGPAVRDNVVRGAFDEAIDTQFDGGVVAGNRVARAGSEEEEGIVVRGSGNVIQGNVAVRNGGYGIFVTDGEGNTVRGNVARDNNQAGIVIQSNESVVAGNRAFNNLADGIVVRGLGLSVRDNESGGNVYVDCAAAGDLDLNVRNDCADGSDFLVGETPN
jgi:parallel beta-helix repeat protein